MSVSRATGMFILKRYTETERLTALNCVFMSGISGKHLPRRGNFILLILATCPFSSDCMYMWLKFKESLICVY